MQRPLKIVTTEEMRLLEQQADAAGHPYAQMMELAGRAVAAAIQGERPEGPPMAVVVLAGPGNNGGDGLVAARCLQEWGHQVGVFCCHRRTEGDPNYERLLARGAEVLHAQDEGSWATLQGWLARAEVIVDALLGTGVTRPIEGLIGQALRLTQERLAPSAVGGLGDRQGVRWLVPPGPAGRPARPTLVAVDCPSGLDCDGGAIDPAAVPADLTVTFACPKAGHFLFPGASYVGRLAVADIGIAPALADEVVVELATAPQVASLLPARPLNAHKGTFGRALLVAGSVNYTGAAHLAAAACARVGAGLVTVALPRPLHPVLASCLPEATWLLLPHVLGVVSPDALGLVKQSLAGRTALLVGPGLTQEQEAVRFVHGLLRPDGQQPQAARQIGFVGQRRESPAWEASSDRPPMVIDADALNALASEPAWPDWLRETEAVLTPHPGEMARLWGVSVSQVEADRWAVARQAAQRWGQVVVLKGAHTAVAGPDGRLTVSPFANPALATAGSGDVLAGIITGLLAQGVAPYEAAVAGVYLHALAAEQLRVGVGGAGMLAGDLLGALPGAMAALRATAGR
ncbi:MAG: NAD(P)H-hydrate dehydratase [Chloroflexi bacterium]|nr:NAD(P)H-hydrate dehydratase [Chloroflexota bacterium]